MKVEGVGFHNAVLPFGRQITICLPDHHLYQERF
jgi:hypothetical protein